MVEFLIRELFALLRVCKQQADKLQLLKANSDIEVGYDQKQMQKVINNLLSNALKHTKAEDTITIKVSQEQDHAIIE